MYTEKELQDKFSVSPNGLKTRIRHLKLKPTKGDRGKNLYDDAQVLLLAQQHKHLINGGLLDTFAPNIQAEIVPARSNKLAVVSRNVELAGFKETCDMLAYTDPLWDYGLLQQASDKSWYLPTAKLGVIMNRLSSFFDNKKSFVHQGFVIVKQDDKSGNSFVWAVNANQ